MTYTEYELSVAPIVWRIKWQVLSTQLSAYKKEIGEREKWMKLMTQTLIEMNQIAQKFHPAELPNPIPTAEYNALSVRGVNWCLRVKREVTLLLGRATSADITRIKL